MFFSPIENDPKKKTHKPNFATHPVPGQFREFVYVYVFFLSLINGCTTWESKMGIDMGSEVGIKVGCRFGCGHAEDDMLGCACMLDGARCFGHGLPALSHFYVRFSEKKKELPHNTPTTPPKPCDIVGLLQESKRPLPRKLRKKSEKGFPGPLGPGVEKARKKSKKS